jgi:hypothetical protein
MKRGFRKFVCIFALLGIHARNSDDIIALGIWGHGQLIGFSVEENRLNAGGFYNNWRRLGRRFMRDLDARWFAGAS